VASKALFDWCARIVTVSVESVNFVKALQALDLGSLR
jgi:hypothetical protein